jgi:DNA-binding IclR family transcriptional regulator
VLKCFSEVEPEIGISSLAKRLSLAKSTVHRLAVTLTSEGLLEQSPETGRYRLGINLFVMGALVRRRLDVSNMAQPFLNVLREKTGETIHLAVMKDTDILYLYNLESRQAIRMKSYIGTIKPAFCTCEGRAIVAYGGTELINKVLNSPLSARTPETQTDPAQLSKCLQKFACMAMPLTTKSPSKACAALAHHCAISQAKWWPPSALAVRASD